MDTETVLKVNVIVTRVTQDGIVSKTPVPSCAVAMECTYVETVSAIKVGREKSVKFGKTSVRFQHVMVMAAVLMASASAIQVSRAQTVE